MHGFRAKLEKHNIEAQNFAVDVSQAIDDIKKSARRRPGDQSDSLMSSAPQILFFLLVLTALFGHAGDKFLT